MPTTPIVSFQDGPRVTVSAMIKDPTTIPKRMLQDITKEFLVDFVLRRLPPTESGVYLFDESTPLFADGEAAIVEEFGEIPTISGREGDRKVAITVKRALGVLISEEMKNRNNVDRVNTQITQARNTMIRTWETAFLMALINHPDIPSINATAAWGAPGSALRVDLAEANSVIDEAAPVDDPNNRFGFDPDTLIIGRTSRTDLITSDDFNKAFVEDKAGESTAYTGQLPGRFFNVEKIMVSREMDRFAPGKALLLQTKVIGGVGDERRIQATPLKRDDDHETWRSNLVRQSAVVIDQPKAACWINGV